MILAPKPLPGPYALRVAAARDRRREKARIHAERNGLGRFTYGRIEVEVTRLEVVERKGNTALSVWMEARRGGQLLSFPRDARPLEFYGPPLCVPDGTYRLERQQGQEIAIANHREDPVAAFREIVGSWVAGVAR